MGFMQVEINVMEIRFPYGEAKFSPNTAILNEGGNLEFFIVRHEIYI